LSISCKYLEANPTIIMTQWCLQGPLSNALADPVFSSAIGAGYKNTLQMLNGCGSVSGGGSVGSLAFAIRATVGNLLTDWYLPSTGELNAMYAARANLPGYFDNTYMASEEFGRSNVYQLMGSTGLWRTSWTKTGLNSGIFGRAIRAF
jgi:hypothetical protein